MSTRVYLVTEKDGTRHLIRSIVPAQAVAHIARDQFGVRVATQDDLISWHRAAVGIARTRRGTCRIKPAATSTRTSRQ